MTGDPHDHSGDLTAPDPDLDPVSHSDDPGQTVEYRDTPARSEQHTPPATAKASPETMQPAKFGRYEVRDLHGRGGMGEVYVGFDPELGRKVAIKVARRTKAGAVARSPLEARQQAQLNHPGIVAVYDVGIQDGQ